jgi:hypothetical protein
MSTPQPKRLRTHQQALLLAALFCVVVWAVPILGLVTLPLEYLNTYFHEICHAIVGTVTGGNVSGITIYGNGGGVTLISGGSQVLEDSAGYMGAALIGAVLIYVGRSQKGARVALRIMATAILISLILWVRAEAVGVVLGISWMLALAVMSLRMKGEPLIFAAQFVGLQLCLQSFQSLWYLVHISAFQTMHNDAELMQQATYIPQVVWAVLWAGFGIAATFVSLKAAWTHPVPTDR